MVYNIQSERTNIRMKSEAVDRSSVVSYDIVEIFCERRRRFTTSEVSYGFSEISRIVLYKIIIVRLRCHSF
jgi:hypothetical protein